MPWLVALGAVSAATTADATAISIEFDSPAGCSSAESFYDGIRSRTSKVKLAEDGEVGSVVRIRLFRAGTKIKGELRLSDQEGEKETRKVDGATCDEVVEALALTVTLALDPDAILTRISQSDLPSPPARIVAPPSAPVPTVRPPAAVPRPTEANHLELGAGWAVAAVVQPGLSQGPTIHTRFISVSPWGPYSVGMVLRYLRNDLFGSPRYGQFSLASAGVELCPLRTQSSADLQVGLCALGIGGWLASRGVALAHPETSLRSWWEVGLGGLGALRLRGGFYVGANLGATIPLIRREFTVNGQSEVVAQSPLVAVLGGLGFDYRF